MLLDLKKVREQQVKNQGKKGANLILDTEKPVNEENTAVDLSMVEKTKSSEYVSGC